MKLEQFIDSVNYRYENTLRIDFNCPLGLGSYCDNLQDLKEECDYVYEKLSEIYDDETKNNFFGLSLGTIAIVGVGLTAIFLLRGKKK